VNPPGYDEGMDKTAVNGAPLSVSESEKQRRINSRLGRRARDRDSLREMRAILDRVYGRRTTAVRDIRS
jgi:hypothetical protein